MPATIPLLSSNPGAPHTLFLDFDGHEQARFTDANGIVRMGRMTVLPFTKDADATTLSDLDAQSIVQIWRRVAEDFAPFNINVTTIQPSSLAPGMPDSAANGRALRIAIGERDPARSDPVLTGGGPTTPPPQGPVSDALLNSYFNDLPNVRFEHPNRFANEYELATIVSKGAGHAFGLRNQSRPTDNVRLATMGELFVAPELRHTWHNGTNELGAAQDDVALLAAALGLRADEANNSFVAARALRQETGFTPAGAGSARLVGSGIIGSSQDADYFSFRVLGTGLITLRLNVGLGVNTSLAQPQDGPGPNLAAQVEVWTENGGTMVASFVAQPPISAAIPLGREITLDATNALLPRWNTGQLRTGARYLIIVRSYAPYGDLGNYTLSVDGPVGFGPRILSAVPSPFPTNSTPTLPNPRLGTMYEVRSIRVTFDRPMDPASFTAADVMFRGPNGLIPINNVVVVNARDPRQFDIFVPLQTAVGSYTLTIGPHIGTAGGLRLPLMPVLEMDQDQDGILGEATDDQFILNFTLGDGLFRPPTRFWL